MNGFIMQSVLKTFRIILTRCYQICTFKKKLLKLDLSGFGRFNEKISYEIHLVFHEICFVSTKLLLRWRGGGGSRSGLPTQLIVIVILVIVSFLPVKAES